MDHAMIPAHATNSAIANSAHRSQTAWNTRDVCGNPACRRKWFALLKDRRRPVFERRWGCCPACVQALVLAAIRRERGDGEPGRDETPHHHRLPLGLILLSQGWITPPQLHHALELQRRAGTGRIGRWLVRECGLDPDCIVRGLGMQWGCPVLPLDGFDPEAMALAVPKLLVETFGAVPLRVAASRILYLAFADRLDASMALAIERISGLKVESGLANASRLDAARQTLLASTFVPATFEQVGNIDDLSSAVAATISRMQPRASRLARIHHLYWLRMWLETGAMRSPGGGIPITTEDVVDRLYTVGAEQ
jgi:hypothetical protein